MSAWFRVVLLLIPGACIAPPPAIAPEPPPPTPTAAPVPIPTQSAAADPGALEQCPVLKSLQPNCGGQLTCVRDDNGCEHCDCRPLPGDEAATIDESERPMGPQ